VVGACAGTTRTCARKDDTCEQQQQPHTLHRTFTHTEAVFGARTASSLGKGSRGSRVAPAVGNDTPWEASRPRAMVGLAGKLSRAAAEGDMRKQKHSTLQREH
jgi:hypothetical protein